MKITSLLSVAMFMSAPIFTFGQTETVKPITRISICDFYLQTGLLLDMNRTLTPTDFKVLAPHSVLLSKDLSAYGSFNGSNLTGSPTFSTMFGIRIREKQKAEIKISPMIRLGLSYFSGTRLTSGLYLESRKRYDTLSSAQSGQSYYLDSVRSESYSMNYTSGQFRFDGSIIFGTDPKVRWSLYSGVGLTAGFSVNAHTEIHYLKSDWAENQLTYGNHPSHSTSDEKYKNKTNMGFSCYLPLGIDFRIGTKTAFWKQIHVFCEFKPGINVQSVPELSIITNAYLQHVLGFRFSRN